MDASGMDDDVCEYGDMDPNPEMDEPECPPFEKPPAPVPFPEEEDLIPVLNKRIRGRASASEPAPAPEEEETPYISLATPDLSEKEEIEVPKKSSTPSRSRSPTSMRGGARRPTKKKSNKR